MEAAVLGRVTGQHLGESTGYINQVDKASSAPAGAISLSWGSDQGCYGTFPRGAGRLGSSAGRLGVPGAQPPGAALLSQKARGRHALCQALETAMLTHRVPSAVLLLSHFTGEKVEGSETP